MAIKKRKPAVNMMEQARAARCYFDSTYNKNEAAELAAFMSIFHPNIKGERLQRIMLSRRTNG